MLSLLNEVFNMIMLSYSIQKSLKHMTFTGYDFLSITAIGDLCIILIGVFGKFINQTKYKVRWSKNWRYLKWTFNKVKVTPAWADPFDYTRNFNGHSKFLY